MPKYNRITRHLNKIPFPRKWKNIKDPVQTREKRALIAIGALLVVIGLTLYWGSIRQVSNINGDKSTQNNQTAVQDSCSINQTITYSCYKKELIDLTNDKGPDAALAILKQEYDTNTFIKGECHQLTHVIGRATLDRYKDLGIAYQKGDYFCASGYFHGVSEEIITQKGAAYMFKNAKYVCARFAKTEYHQLDHYNCVHGIGHGLLEAANGDLFMALKSCDTLNDNWEQTSCYSGVFMQNVMIEQSPDESVDHKSAYLRDDDLLYPCTAVDEKYKWGCYIFQSSYAIAKTHSDFPKVFGLCKALDQKYRNVCYGSLGRDASGVSNFEQDRTIAYCNQGPDDEAKLACFKGAAINLIYVYHSDKQAHQLCSALSESFKYACNGGVKDYYRTFQ